MSVDLWAWLPSCDDEGCCGDCDKCKKADEEESADAKWQKRIEAIKEDIHRYWMDCDFAVDDKECKQCGKNVFGSILRIIDKHTKEGAEE